MRAGVEKAICVSWDIPSSIKAREIAIKYDCVYYSVGVHPDNVEDFNSTELENLIKSSLSDADKSQNNVIAQRSCHKNAVAIPKTNKLVAIGEIGLDYYRIKDNKEKQKQAFISQIELANKYHLPIIIHCREAYGDTLEILKRYAPFKYGAVMHCYSGSLEFANVLLKLGVKLSFTGVVTYKNATNVKEVVKNISLDSFFLETDCPYLAPTPHRGERNEPAFVVDTAKYVAELREMPLPALISATDQNAKKFFSL